MKSLYSLKTFLKLYSARRREGNWFEYCDFSWEGGGTLPQNS